MERAALLGGCDDSDGKRVRVGGKSQEKPGFIHTRVSSARSQAPCGRGEGVTPELKIAINSTPTHFFGTRYSIECQKVSYTLYIVSKSVIYALYSVKKCLIHSIDCYFQSWCFSLEDAGKINH